MGLTSPLPDDLREQLVAQYANVAGPPPAAPVPPWLANAAATANVAAAAPPPAAPPPWQTGTASATPGALANGGAGAHQPPGFVPPSPSGVGADQTIGYTGPKDAAGNPIAAAPVAPLTSTTRTTGGSSNSTSSTVQKGIHLSPETIDAKADWLAKQKEAGAAMDAGLAQARAAEQQGMHDKAALIRGSAEAARIEGDRGAAELETKRAHIASMNDALTNDKTDPDHWWHSRNTVGKIGAALSMIAGGALAGFRGNGENQGAKFISEAIDRDIAAQRDAHAAKREGVQGAVTMYNLAASGLHDEQDRHAATRATLLNATIQDIDAKVAQSNDPLERARLLDTRAQLARETATTLASIDERTADRVTNSSSSSVTSGSSSSTVQTGGPGSGGLTADHIVKGPDGRMYMVGSPEEGRKLREDAAVAARLKANITRAIALRGFFQSYDDRAKMAPLLTDIKKDMFALNSEKLKASGMGAEMIDSAVGDPASIWDFHGETRLKALQDSVNNDLATNFASAGAVPLSGDISYGTQNGKPVAMGTGLPVIPTGKGAR